MATNTVNINFVTDVCSAILTGKKTIAAAITNAQTGSFFIPRLTTADFLGTYSDLSSTDVSNALTAVAAISGVLSANSNQYSNALTKVGRNTNNGNSYYQSFRPNNLPPGFAGNISNRNFISQVCSTALSGTQALSTILALVNDYQSYFSSALQSTDFDPNGSFSDLTTQDIANAVQAAGAVLAVLGADSNKLMNYLLTVAR